MATKRKKKKQKQPSRLVKIVFVLSLAAFLIAMTTLLYLSRQKVPTVYEKILAVRGTVYETTNNNESVPLFNVTVVAVTDKEHYIKALTNESGQFYLWITYPKNLSIPVFIYCVKQGYSDSLGQGGWRNQTLHPKDLDLLERTETYEVWGVLNFETVYFVKESN